MSSLGINWKECPFSLSFLALKIKPCRVACTFNSRTWKAETDGSLEFKAILFYRVSSRTPRIIKRNKERGVGRAYVPELAEGSTCTRAYICSYIESWAYFKCPP